MIARKTSRKEGDMRTLFAAVLTAVVVASFTATSAQAAPPQPVSIAFTVTVFTPRTFSGTWASSGAIADSGTFVRTDVNFTGSLANSPTVGAFQSKLLLSSSLGTFTVFEQILFTPTGVIGTWQIMSGTGAYANVTGHGTFQFINTFSFVDSGVVSKA
jgi:hypothetical protein